MHHVPHATAVSKYFVMSPQGYINIPSRRDSKVALKKKKSRHSIGGEGFVYFQENTGLLVKMNMGLGVK